MAVLLGLSMLSVAWASSEKCSLLQAQLHHSKLDEVAEGVLNTRQLEDTPRVAVMFEFKPKSEAESRSFVPTAVPEIVLTADSVASRGISADILTRPISEALPWMLWIADNYENLPHHVVFMHPHLHDWHRDGFDRPIPRLTTSTQDAIKNARPACVQMLGTCQWGQYRENGMSDYMSDAEVTALSMLAVHLNLTHWDAADRATSWNRYFSGRVQGSENVVSREAIRHHPVELYKNIVNLMVENPQLPWAYALERLYEILFDAACRDSSEPVPKAHSFAGCPLALIGPGRKNDEIPTGTK